MSVAMDEFFPMAEGPGGDTRMAQWRRMASLWCPAGVVRGVGSELGLAGWAIGEQTMAVAPGACWVNGFYAENTGPYWIGCPSNVGLVVARLDLAAQTVALVFKEGPSHGPTQDPNGLWEVPLVYLWGDSAEDRRTFVPPPPPPPPVADVPERTPRGTLSIQDGPDTEVVVGNGHNVIVAYPFTSALFTPGRAYRFTAYHDGSGLTANIGEGDGQDRYWCELWARDNVHGERSRVPLNQPGRAAMQGGAGNAGTASVVVNDLREGAMGVISIAQAAGTMLVRLPAWSFRLEVDDAGRA